MLTLPDLLQEHPLLTAEIEGGGGRERRRVVLAAPLPGIGLGTRTQLQEVAGRGASPSFAKCAFSESGNY